MPEQAVQRIVSKEKFLIWEYSNAGCAIVNCIVWSALLRFDRVNTSNPGGVFNLDIPSGEFVSIMGASGSGKSTFLKTFIIIEEGFTGTRHSEYKTISVNQLLSVANVDILTSMYCLIPSIQQSICSNYGKK